LKARVAQSAKSRVAARQDRIRDLRVESRLRSLLEFEHGTRDAETGEVFDAALLQNFYRQRVASKLIDRRLQPVHAIADPVFGE
jgi:hypothetical protein